MDEVTIKEENDSVVSVEKLFEFLSGIKVFHGWIPKNPSNIVTTKTAQELIKIPHFANLEFISLSELPETFDIDTFYEYFKENKTLSMLLNFNGSISEEFKTHLQEYLIGTLLAYVNKYK